MNRMSKKLNKKGFTLAELLIVVAIIAVLVVVSVPIFSSKLEKAREAADVANMRAAKAAAASMYLSDESSASKGPYYYDADNGVLENKKDDINGYGQGTKTEGGVTYGDYYKDTMECKGQIIEVTIKVPEKVDEEVKVGMEWVPSGTTK